MSDWYAAFPGDSRYRLHVQCYESAIYQSSNESDVVLNGWVEKTSGGGIFTGNGNASAGAALNGSGIGVGNWSPYDFSAYSAKLLLSTTRRIAHNVDGSKNITVEFSASDPNTLGYIDIGTQNLVLTPIPRGAIDRWGGSWLMNLLERWTGSAWVLQVLERWNGTAWVREI